MSQWSLEGPFDRQEFVAEKKPGRLRSSAARPKNRLRVTIWATSSVIQDRNQRRVICYAACLVGQPFDTIAYSVLSKSRFPAIIVLEHALMR